MDEQQPFGFLLTYLMRSLEADPDHVFTLEDLKDRAEAEIQPLVEAGFIAPCAGTDGTAAAYEGTVAPMIKEIRALKDLRGTGAPKQLDPRLFYLGTWTMKAERYCWFFALVTSTKQLGELMTEKASRYFSGERVVIVTPSFADPTAPDNLGIPYPTEILTLGALGLLKVPDESVRRQLLSKSLSGPPNELEKEIKEHDFKLRCSIVVTGKLERKDLNVIYVNNVKVRLGDPLFVLFLTLMLQQFTKPSGHITVKDLDESGVVEKHRIDHEVNIFRKHFERAVRETKVFIDRDKHLEIRISVHKSFFRVGTTLLAKHANPKVQTLAAALKKAGVREPEKVMG